MEILAESRELHFVFFGDTSSSESGLESDDFDWIAWSQDYELGLHDRFSDIDTKFYHPYELVLAFLDFSTILVVFYQMVATVYTETFLT